jgi:hypothetical protein
MRDPYVFLAVPRSATADDIKKSFRLLAKRLHPDANNNDPKAAALFAELNAAHEILGDEEKRRAFDRGEIDAEGKPTRQVIASRSNPSAWHVVTHLMVVMVMLATASTLIMRGLTPEQKISATRDGGDRDLSPVGTNEEHAPVALPEQADPGRSEPRLILQQSVSYTAAGIPLGIQVGGETDGLAVEINGLPSGTTISAGRQLPGGGWRILATDVGNAMIHAPAGFSGTIDLAIELRLIDDTVVDHGSLHREWLPKPTVAQATTESAAAMTASESAATSERSADKALATVAPTARERLNLLTAKVDGRESAAVGPTEVLRKVEPGTPARDMAAAVTSAKPKRHVVHPTIHIPVLPEPPTDPYGVYVAGARVGADPDRNIRAQLMRDDASRELRTDLTGRQSQ